jgi:hypothetical protein
LGFFLRIYFLEFDILFKSNSN